MNNKQNFSLPDAAHKSTFVRQGFNEISRKYDLLNDLMTAGLHRSWKKDAVSKLNVTSNMKVLDLCTGTGDLAYRASKAMNHSGLTVALDFAWDMMVLGQNRFNGIPTNLAWIGSNAENLPFLDNSFDAAIVGFGLRNVVFIESALKEVLRVLKPGGIFVSLDTASAEWKSLNWAYKLHMKIMVPTLGALIARSPRMYSYLTASAEAFESPQKLRDLFERVGFVNSQYEYRPRFVGGAALVWGRKPKEPSV